MWRQAAVRVLWRWHRRAGLLAALFLVVLASSGIVLNHSSDLGLDRRFVSWDWLLHYYGDTSVTLPAFPVAGHWVHRSPAGMVYLDAVPVKDCRGDLVGAAVAGDSILAACAEELLLLTGRGELVEYVTASSGLPAPLSGIGSLGEDLVLGLGSDWRVADLDAMQFDRAAPAGSLVAQVAPGRLPASLRAQVPAYADWLTWERLLVDLHSGRLFGPGGVIVADVFAALSCLIAASGVAMWFLHRRRR